LSKLLGPLTIKGLELPNKVVMAPMCMYCAGEEGLVTDWHLAHYAARAIGGVGLIIQEATAVEKRGRLSPNDLGIWDDDQIKGLKKLVDLVHEFGSKAGIQLGHGGRKARPGKGEIIGPSSIAFSEDHQVPREMEEKEIKEVVNAFKKAAERACAAGYDIIELHGAHGYLIHQFLSPYSNQRQDDYGGSFENLLRFPLEIIQEVRKILPSGKLLMLRISAVEYIQQGYSFNDMVKAAKIFAEVGIDILDVSTGGAGPSAPRTWPGFQVPYAQKIREELNVPVIACGLITDPGMAEELVSNNRTDLVALGRALLRDPNWVLNAARELGIPGKIPWSYARAYPEDVR